MRRGELKAGKRVDLLLLTSSARYAVASSSPPLGSARAL